MIETNFPERACSEHISDQVNLKWSLLNTETNGVALLNGISLSSAMLSLITVAPLQWGKQIYYCYLQKREFSFIYLFKKPFRYICRRGLIATTDGNQMLHGPKHQIRS